MAKKPGPPEKPASDEDDPANVALAAELNRRINRATLDRNRHQARMADCYKYAMPWRHKFFLSIPTDQLDELFDATAMTVVEDFSADMLNTFTPVKNNWIEIKPTEKLDVGSMRQLEGPLKDYQRVLFAEMSRSNLYQALQEAYNDLGVGTMSLLIEDRAAAEPIHCQAIPVTESLLDRGPYSSVDKFRNWKVRAEEIKVLWPNAVLTGPQTWKPGDINEVDVKDGCWRDWSDVSNETYRYAVLANNKLIYQERYSGAGSCPFITARWARDSTTAWGVGPTYRSIPDIKTLNHIRYLLLKKLDSVVDPVTSYEDDGVINLDRGVEPGTWIPRATGSEPPKPVEAVGKFDVAWLQVDQLVSAIRRAHYQDRPEQKGKTPPSASQWADEAAERARRMGSPATNLVQELQYPIVRRFAYLLSRRGALPRIELNGRDITVEPISPILRAQEQEEVVRNDKWAELIIGRFGPQVGMIVINIVKYAQKQGSRLGIDKDLMRDENEIANAIKQLLPVLQSTGAIPAAGAPAVEPTQVPGTGGAM